MVNNASSVVFSSIKRFLEEDRSLQAAGLTFYTLFALAPLFALGLSLVGLVSYTPDQAMHLEAFFLKHFVPHDTGAIEHYIHNFVVSSARLSGISSVIFLLTSIFLINSIETCFNQIWRVTKHELKFIRRAFHYFMILIVSPLCLGLSLAISALILSLGWLQHPVLLTGMGELIKLLPFVMTWLAITALYYWLPHTRVGFKNALFSAFIIAFLFELMKSIFQLSVLIFPTYQIVYGTLALLPIFLLWIYLSWMAVLFGATMAYEMRKQASHHS